MYQNKSYMNSNPQFLKVQLNLIAILWISPAHDSFISLRLNFDRIRIRNILINLEKYFQLRKHIFSFVKVIPIPSAFSHPKIYQETVNLKLAYFLYFTNSLGIQFSFYLVVRGFVCYWSLLQKLCVNCWSGELGGGP